MRGWDVCRFDDQGRWIIDLEGLAGATAPRDLARRVARLAADRRDAESAMDEPPGGMEAGDDI
jgi:hypothetical protein